MKKSSISSPKLTACSSRRGSLMWVSQTRSGLCEPTEIPTIRIGPSRRRSIRNGAKHNWITSIITFARMGEHKYAWDFETLARSLRRFGFTEVSRREFDPALDAEFRRTGTLYVTAIKP